MLRESTTDNIRFIIIDIQESTTLALARMTRMRPDDGTPEPTRPPCPVAHTLTFTPPGKRRCNEIKNKQQKYQNQY